MREDNRPEDIDSRAASMFDIVLISAVLVAIFVVLGSILFHETSPEGDKVEYRAE
ncbi:MAG: hypothetical protein WC711_00635 [Candidatus Staskawiczbacteria bacterium]|jgi:hypothetical protein